MKCDVIARGVIAAVRTVGLQVPLVVRLEGTNVEEGQAIIRGSGLNVIPADDLDDAAQKIVSAIKEARSEEHTSELQSRQYIVCRLLLEKKKTNKRRIPA